MRFEFDWQLPKRVMSVGISWQKKSIHFMILFFVLSFDWSKKMVDRAKLLGVDKSKLTDNMKSMIKSNDVRVDTPECLKCHDKILCFDLDDGDEIHCKCGQMIRVRFKKNKVDK